MDKINFKFILGIIPTYNFSVAIGSSNLLAIVRADLRLYYGNRRYVGLNKIPFSQFISISKLKIINVH